jgi:CheY-like chemotaxis protein
MDKRKKSDELIIANKELAFQKEKKEKRAASDYITKPVKTNQLLSLCVG